LHHAVMMNHSTWTRPEFREINLSAEIGMYVEAEDDRYFDEHSRELDRSSLRRSNPGRGHAGDRPG